MSSYENALAENAGVPKNELQENLEQREPEIIKETMKALDCLIDQSQLIRRYADKIDILSAELFIKSFLFNINEIKIGHESIKSYFEAIAELHNISIEKNKSNNSAVKRNSEKKENNKGSKTEDIPEIMNIKSELEKIAIEIISKSEDVKNYLKNMNEISNDDNFVAGAYNSFRSLNDTILKLDSIEKMIAAYSK